MTDTKAAGEIVNPQIAQTERIGLGDLVIAGLLAVAEAEEPKTSSLIF